MEEVWKDIYFVENGIEYDYRGLYQVSNKGNVKSLNYNHTTGKEKILKPQKSKNCYLRVGLCKNEKQKWFYVHRLVAFMFIENDNPEYKTEVNHIDEDKENNSVDNIEWCTKEYNNNHGTRNKRSGKSQSKKVIGFSLTDTKVIILQSIRQAKKFGFDFGSICKCCKGKYYESHEYKGYKWYYLDDYKNNKKVDCSTNRLK